MAERICFCVNCKEINIDGEICRVCKNKQLILPYTDIYWDKIDVAKQNDLVREFLHKNGYEFDYFEAESEVRAESESRTLSQKMDDEYQEYLRENQLDQPTQMSGNVVNLDIKINALTGLMTQGIISSDELVRLIQAISLTGTGNVGSSDKQVLTPAEYRYNKFIEEKLRNRYKSPSSVKYPPFNSSMVKQGKISLDGREQIVKYIETYIDAANSYGAMLREETIIIIDAEFNLLHAAQHVNLGTLLGKTSGWVTVV